MLAIAVICFCCLSVSALYLSSLMHLNPVEGAGRLRSAWRRAELEGRERAENLEPRLRPGGKHLSSFHSWMAAARREAEALCVWPRSNKEWHGPPLLPLSFSQQQPLTLGWPLSFTQWRWRGSEQCYTEWKKNQACGERWKEQKLFSLRRGSQEDI